MNQKTLSILIPAYNEQEFIGPCLDPLVEMQKNYREQNIIIEIIVCDNNSTDSTSSIVTSYSPHVILVHETAKGAHAARQKAFEASTGEIIATLDADCVINSDWIDRALNHFENKNVVSVAGLCEFSNDYSSAWTITWLQRYVIPPIHIFTTKILKKGGIMLAGNAWYRRSILEKIGGFDSSFEFYGDDAHTALTIAKTKDPKEIMVYDRNLIVKTSSRRWQHTGYWKTMYQYIVNYVWVKIFKKNKTQKNEMRP